jgi:hypothetical protein
LFHRRFSAWLAMLALVLGGLAPALTQALVAGTERAGWVQICTASGMSWVQIEAQAADAQASPDQPGAASSGCTWCQHQGAAGLPPVVLPLPLTVGHPPRGAAPVAVAALAPWWPPGLSRAPPAHA